MSKILVIDDNPIHIAGAKAQLRGHEVTTLTSSAAATELFRWGSTTDEEKFARLKAERGLASKWGNEEAWRQARREAQISFEHDIVLIDLLMPVQEREFDLSEEREKEFVGKEMPTGIFLALAAAAQGAKYVAVVTDSCHHSHPSSSCFDFCNKKGVHGEFAPAPFSVEGARVILANNRAWIRRCKKEDLARFLTAEEYLAIPEGERQRATVRVKDWGRALEYLLDPLYNREKDFEGYELYYQ
ncbi:MAG: hypothetical protein Q8Q18_00070 [bacterium]|nr:hypothetical protein [bacterium]